ncbi:cysteine desulfurase [Bacillus sp. JCM 19047]|nr:cysteine desulfurase [Bacillus sp. JCM 19047]
MHYFDYSSTSPMSERALTAYRECALEQFANPMSAHTLGVHAEWHLHYYRERIATQLNVAKDAIYFTGSGSEANFLAIVSLVRSLIHKGKHILTTKTEHPSVLSTFLYLQTQGFDVDYVEVLPTGEVSIPSLLAVIREDTVFCSVSIAASEVGTIQNVHILSEILRSHDILFHSDCVQGLGKIEIDLSLVDAASFSAHKLYAPKGLGIIYLAPEHYFKPFLQAVTHEYGMRPGTVDLPAIAAFTVELEHALSIRETLSTKHIRWQCSILSELGTDVSIVGTNPPNRLPFHLGMMVHGWSGQQFMLECSRAGLCIAIGSACRAGQAEPLKLYWPLGIQLNILNNTFALRWRANNIRRYLFLDSNV